MFKFNIKASGFEKGQEDTKKRYQRILMKSMFKMEEIAIFNAPIDRGSLRQEISLFPQILADKYILESRAPYSAAMEYGTRPFYAPIKPLAEWAKRKLGDPDLGYAVQAKIAKFGITAQPFMRPALYEVKSYWLPAYGNEEFSGV